MLFFPVHLQFPSKNKQHACNPFILKSSEPVLPSLQDILSEADVGIIKTHRQNLESSYRTADNGAAQAQEMDVGTDSSWVQGQTMLQDRNKTFICDTVTRKSRNRRYQML